jgi:hypothetical protein
MIDAKKRNFQVYTEGYDNILKLDEERNFFHFENV